MNYTVVTHAPTKVVAPSRRSTVTGAIADLLRLVGLIAFAFTIFFPYIASLVPTALTLPYLVFGSLWIYGIGAILRRFGVRWQLAAWLVLPLSAAAVTFYLYGHGVAAPTPSIVRDYVMILPTALIAGMFAARDPKIRQFEFILRTAAAITAALAILEFVTRTQLFPGNVVTGAFGKDLGRGLLSSDGGLRAVVATDHPLVLAALLAATIPFLLRRPPSVLRAIEVLLLLAGIYATDSMGPLLVAVATVVIGIAWPARWWGVRLSPTWLVTVLVGAATALLVAVGSWILTPSIDPNSPIDDSTQYRFALYSLIPRIIFEGHPLGFGLGKVPSDTLIIDNAGTAMDAAKTVDSQLVLLVIKMGVVGLILFAVIMWLALRGIASGAQAPMTTVPLLVMTVCGIFLAILSWSSVGAYWEFLIGAAVMLGSSPRSDLPWRRRSLKPVLF